MRDFDPGLVHTPLTAFTREHRIDFERYGRLIEFHLRHGADALALPMHEGESVSLTDAERRALLEYALERVGGRVPVIAHVSQSGTALAVCLARHAEKVGAAAIVAAVPYYWTPPAAMLVEHFVQIGSAVRLPFFVYNAPAEMGGVKVTTEIAVALAGRLEHFAGVVDASLDWQFMIDVLSSVRRIRPRWRLVPAAEFLVSAGAIGGSGAFAPLAGIAPRLVRRLYERCREERYHEARADQSAVAALRKLMKPHGVAGLKSAARALGRDCGDPRPPLRALGEAEHAGLAQSLDAMAALREEPRGW
ncbi:MAG TPA: dihydrodipicolinate synthase family protein [Burkholderiales bacterium]|nr:dihydrodipicolinate synthase family protein [Burkholderiales bacterium]